MHLWKALMASFHNIFKSNSEKCGPDETAGRWNKTDWKLGQRYGSLSKFWKRGLVCFHIFTSKELRVNIAFSGMITADAMGCFEGESIERGQTVLLSPQVLWKWHHEAFCLVESKSSCFSNRTDLHCRNNSKTIILYFSLNTCKCVHQMSGVLTVIRWMIRWDRWLQSLTAAYWLNGTNLQPDFPPSSFKNIANILGN